MNRKWYVLIIVICLLIFGVGYFIYSQNNISIGDVTYQIPEGYNVQETSTVYNLANGNNSISLVKKTKNHDVQNVIKEYVKTKSKKNITITITSFDVNGVTIYKSNSDKEPLIAHYWYTNDGVVYELITENLNSNTDDLVINLISNSKIKS